MRRLILLFAILLASSLSWASGGAGGSPGLGGAGGAAVIAPVVTPLPPTPAADELGLAKQIWDAVTQRNYWLVGALVLILAVMAVRRFGSGKVPWLKTGAGGVVTTALMGVGAGIATALLAGQAMSLEVLLAGLKMAWVAAGGYTAVKGLFEGPPKKTA